MSNKFDSIDGGDYNYLGLNAAKSGPLVDRSCTDLWCLCVWLIFQCGVIFICTVAYMKGDPMRLTYPYDPDRKIF